jgi:lysophospholipase L1-like esterase
MSAVGESENSGRRGRDRMTRALVRALPAAAFATFLWWRGHRRAAALLGAVTLTVVVLGVAWPRAGAALDRALARLGAAAAHGLTVVLAGLAWAVVVVPVWAVSRLFRYSPLDPGWSTTTSVWAYVDRSRLRSPDLRPDRPERTGLTELRPSPSTRRRSALRLVPVLVVLVALGVWVVDRRGGNDASVTAIDLTGRGPTVTGEKKDIPDEQLAFNGLPVDDYAHEDEPWIGDFMREMLGTNSVPDLIVGARNGEFRGEHLNIVDGRRVTYTPSDPTIDVWFFGGSTMFGIGQRDDHTIPSVVVKLAEEDGIRIRATNFGVSGDVNWQGTIRFAEALEGDLPEPDLVVFYDGVNDRGLASTRVSEGNVDPSVSSRLPVSDAERDQGAETFPDWEEPAFGPERDELEITLAAEQYGRGVRTARALAAQRDIPIVHVWQPQPFAKAASPADEELYRRLDFDPRILPASTRTYREIRERSGAEPLDLSTVFDDVDVPIYFDSSHTNELGARIVATELYERLRSQLEAIEEAAG